jgi:hypothetical protein
VVNNLINNFDLCKAEGKNKGKDKERREIMNSGKETYFAVYFDHDGGVIKVEVQKDGTGKMEEVPGERIEESGLPAGINEIHSNSILGRTGASPCCYVDHITGYKYCWAPCR